MEDDVKEEVVGQSEMDDTRAMMADFDATAGIAEEHAKFVDSTRIGIIQDKTENIPEGLKKGDFYSPNSVAFVAASEIIATIVDIRDYHNLMDKYVKGGETKEYCAAYHFTRSFHGQGRPSKKVGPMFVPDMEAEERPCQLCPYNRFLDESIDSSQLLSKFKGKGLDGQKCGSRRLFGLLWYPGKETPTLSGLPVLLRVPSSVFMKDYRKMRFVDEEGREWYSLNGIVTKLGREKLPGMVNSGITLEKVRLQVRTVKMMSITGEPYLPVFYWEAPSQGEVDAGKLLQYVHAPREISALQKMVVERYVKPALYRVLDDEMGALTDGDGQKSLPEPEVMPASIIESGKPEDIERLQQEIAAGPDPVNIVTPGGGLQIVTEEEAQQMEFAKTGQRV